MGAGLLPAEQQRQGSALPATSRLRCSHSPQRESTKVSPCGILSVTTAEKKNGAYTPFTAPYFAFVRLGRVFTRLSACSAYRAFSAAVSAEEEFAVLFLYSAVIYTQWV